MVQTTPLNLRFGAPGLLFDQEYGLLAYAPVYILAATGLYQMWRAGGELRRQAIEITFIFAALLATVGAFGIWWGGTAAPARPIASGLLLLMLPIAVGVSIGAGRIAAPRRAAPAALDRRRHRDHAGDRAGRPADQQRARRHVGAARFLVAALGAVVAGADLHPPSAGPSRGCTPSWWLAIAGGRRRCCCRGRAARAPASRRCSRSRRSRSRCGSSRSPSRCCRRRGRSRAIDLGARARLAALDGFDARARPASIVYDPLRKGAAADALPQLVLGVKAAAARRPQPVRVIHNGRFSLPAGTYTIERAVQRSRRRSRRCRCRCRSAATGRRCRRGRCSRKPGEQWQTPLWLPVDASFVGLRGPVELERAIAAITITPIAVVDAGARPLVPIVLAAGDLRGRDVVLSRRAALSGAAGLLDASAGSASHVTVAVPPGHTAPVVLRMHPGARPTT